MGKELCESDLRMSWLWLMILKLEDEMKECGMKINVRKWNLQVLMIESHESENNGRKNGASW